MFILNIVLPVDISNPVNAFCAAGLQRLASLGGKPLKVVLRMMECNLLCDDPGTTEDTLLEVFHELGIGVPPSYINEEDDAKMQHLQQALDGATT